MKKLILLFLICLSCHVHADDVTSSVDQAKVYKDLSEDEWLKVAEDYDIRDWVIWWGIGGHSDIKSFTPEKTKECETEGLRILERIANNNRVYAMEYLTEYHGTYTKDWRKALYWAEKAAESGSSYAMYVLAVSYSTGDGVIRDDAEHVKWVLLSAARGEERAKKRLDDISECKTYKSYIEGENKAREWMQTHRSAFFCPD